MRFFKSHTLTLEKVNIQQTIFTTQSVKLMSLNEIILNVCLFLSAVGLPCDFHIAVLEINEHIISIYIVLIHNPLFLIHAHTFARRR